MTWELPAPGATTGSGCPCSGHPCLSVCLSTAEASKHSQSSLISRSCETPRASAAPGFVGCATLTSSQPRGLISSSSPPAARLWLTPHPWVNKIASTGPEIHISSSPRAGPLPASVAAAGGGWDGKSQEPWPPTWHPSWEHREASGAARTVSALGRRMPQGSPEALAVQGGAARGGRRDGSLHAGLRSGAQSCTARHPRPTLAAGGRQSSLRA